MTDQERLDRIDELAEMIVWLGAGYAENGPTTAEITAQRKAHELAHEAALRRP